MTTEIKRIKDLVKPDERVSLPSVAAAAGIPHKLLSHRVYDRHVPVGTDGKFLGDDLIAADKDESPLLRPSDGSKRGRGHGNQRPTEPAIRIADLDLPDGHVSITKLLHIANPEGLCQGTLRSRVEALGFNLNAMTADQWRAADADDNLPLLRIPTGRRTPARGPAPTRNLPAGGASFEDDDLLTVLDVADALGQSEESARKRILRHNIPRVPNIAGRAVWKGSDIRRAFFSGQPAPAPVVQRPAPAPVAKTPVSAFFAVVDALDAIIARHGVSKAFVGDICVEWACRP